MILLQPNIFFINETLSDNEKTTSRWDEIKQYLSILADGYKTDKLLRAIENNPSRFIALADIKTIEERNNVLLQLEKSYDKAEEYIEEGKLDSILGIPMKYMLKKVNRTNLSVQLLLTSHEIEEQLENNATITNK